MPKLGQLIKKHMALFKKNKVLTVKQEAKKSRSMAAILISIFILVSLTFIGVVTFENTRVREYYITDLAVTRIINSGSYTYKILNANLDFYFQELETFQSELDDEDLNTLDSVDEEKIKKAVEELNFKTLLDDIGILYNSKAYFPDKIIELTKSEKIEGTKIFNGGDIEADKTDTHYNDFLYVAMPPCEHHQEIQGIIGRIQKKTIAYAISTSSHKSQTTSLILDSEENIVLLSSPLNAWRFYDDQGNELTNYTTAMRYWCTDDDYAKYEEFRDNKSLSTLNVGKNDRNGMIYRATINHSSDDDTFYYVYMAPTSLLVDTISHLTNIVLVMLYASIIFSTVVITACIIIIFRQRIQAKLKAAYLDTTGLNSEHSFYRDCNAIALTGIQNSYGLVYINIKELKKINANYGAAFANEVINDIATHIGSHITDEECACVQNGNFLILCKGSQEDVLFKCHTLNENLLEYERLKLIHLQLRYGIKMMDVGYYGEIPTEVSNAKFAESKTTDDNIICFYSETMHHLQEEEDELVNSFEHALANHEFEVYLQLKYDLRKADWGGAEALVRWNNPKKGLISPGKFIPLFEENGYITQLDAYVFEQTCKLISEMLEKGERVVPVSINLSKRHFTSLDFIEKYEEIVKRYNIPHDLIEFEITEGLLMDNVETFTKFICVFHENNYDIAMDDFGAGYSSLNMIHQLDFDVIKIDSKFFRDGLDDSNKTIIESIIDLCHKLKKTVVAEGVEQQHEVDFLKSIGCDIIQGYFYAKPLPVQEFKKKITTNPEKE